MNRNPSLLPRMSQARTVFLLVGLCTLPGSLPKAGAQTTAFTYQGQLKNAGLPASGSYDLTFTLFATNVGGAVINGPVTNSAVSVTNGLFTVSVDFGAGIFPGADRWLEIATRTNGSAAVFDILAPRQKLTSTPYAVTAGNLSGALAASQLTGTLPGASLSGVYPGALSLSNPANQFSGNGGGLTNVNAAALAGFGPASFWLVGGNASVGSPVLGSTGSQPLQFIVGNRRALQLEVASVSLGLGSALIAQNVIGGSSANVVSNGVFGGTIGGGGNLTTFFFGSAPLPNVVSDHYGTVAGGLYNVAGNTNAAFDDASFATVSGGVSNLASGPFASVGGGRINWASGTNATIAGGFANTAAGWLSHVGGGDFNYAAGTIATIGGGEGNYGIGIASTIAGGADNYAPGEGSFIGGGGYDGTNGYGNVTQGALSTVTGGNYNWAAGYASMIPGGLSNSAAGLASFAAGYRASANHDGAFVWADSEEADFASTGNNQFSIRASGGVQLANNTSLFCGSGTRQMLNLWGTQYGIGVQNYTTYMRADSPGSFAWYSGGTHNDAETNAGGGLTLMILNSHGLRVNGTFVSASDRNVKRDFAPVDSRSVLEKVVSMPLQTWAYKLDPATRHLGPVAQDFKAAFDLGADDKTIATVDADGVALAAIQGLNQKLEQKEDEIRALKTRLDDLEKLVESISRQRK
jgi:trimeric autotransporter adhesin